MKQIDISDLPKDMREIAIQHIKPTSDNYFIISTIDDKENTGLVDTIGGLSYFGEDEWEMIVGGFHPDIRCLELCVVLH